MDEVTSADGTTISFRSYGAGLPLVVLPGNNRRAHHYEVFADAMSGYRVHSIDRRGRGTSGPQGPSYGIEREVEDALAVLDATGADLIFGHSYGGLIALHVALARRLTSLAVYEPGVSLNGAFPRDWFPEYTRLFEAGRPHAAMATFLKHTRVLPLGDPPMIVHRALAVLLLRGRDGAETRAMMPTTPPELGEVFRWDSDGSRYAAITTPTLLLGGEKGPKYLTDALPRLADLMPDARAEILPGANHNAPDLSAPEAVARSVKQFFGSPLE